MVGSEIKNMLKHQPKTLAKTLDYIIRRSPGEHGLFWDPDGTMPWKEFYWTLQQDLSLRFVRESTICELALLGIELPFLLDGKLLRLRPEFDRPAYPPAPDLPKRLYFGLKPKNLVHTQNFGLKSTRRPFLALCSKQELAIRIAARIEPAPILVEILAREACESGLSFLAAGGDLYLAESVPAEFILFPKVRQDSAERLAAPVSKPKDQPSSLAAPGSFIVKPHHLQAPDAGKSPGKAVKTDGKGAWKKERRKERRKERHKRDI
jgi:putative RNA 2'-phosphotransferase